MSRRALVIGGGVAGIRAALDLDAQGYETVLIEKTPRLGGVLAFPGLETLYGSGARGAEKLDALRRPLADSRVRVLTRTELKSVSGYLGNFKVVVESGSPNIGIEKLEPGTIILATGARIHDPVGTFGYGSKRNVQTSVQLGKRLADPDDKYFGCGGQPPASAVFIQCVGSRCVGEGGHSNSNPGCSRYCCSATVEQALDLARLGVKTTVLYRDMRCVSPGAEEMYREARGAGVLFVRVPDDRPPEVMGTSTEAKSVVAHDVMLGRDIEAPADLVVLAVGLVPDTEAVDSLREILKVPVGPDGFFMERHPELGPVETVVDGVFVCGSAVGAKAISDSLSEAAAAAGKAGQIMARKRLSLEPTVAEVDASRCRGCGACVEICEFHAPSLETGELGVPVARVNQASCKGCGTCVAWCPSGAMTAHHFTDNQIEAMMTSLLKWEAAR